MSHRRTGTFGLDGGRGEGGGRSSYWPKKIHNARKRELYIRTRMAVKTKTQFYPDDCVAAVVWVVLDNRMSHRRTGTFGLDGGREGAGHLIGRKNYIMLESASCTYALEWQ